MRPSRETGDAIKALIGRAVIILLNAKFCFSSSTTDKEDGLVLLPYGQQLFIFLQFYEKCLDYSASDTHLTFSFLISRKKGIGGCGSPRWPGTRSSSCAAAAGAASIRGDFCSAGSNRGKVSDGVAICYGWRGVSWRGEDMAVLLLMAVWVYTMSQ